VHPADIDMRFSLVFQSATATVRVTVADVNDNNPSFSRNIYTFEVPENEADHLVGTVSATDADGDAVIIKYSFEYPNK